MENASKALIIAGSVLITIIVISLSVLVFRNFSESAKEMANMDEQEIASFNSRITPYIGNNISGSQVRALVELVRAIDLKAINQNDNKRVTIKDNNNDVIVGIDNKNKITGDGVKKIATNQYYNVSEVYNRNGLISEITIKKAN